jgi:hypothetical protein
MSMLVRREYLSVVRNPTVIKGVAIESALVAVFIGLAFSNMPKTKAGNLTRASVLFLICIDRALILLNMLELFLQVDRLCRGILHHPVTLVFHV